MSVAPRTVAPATVGLPPHLRAALRLLLQALDYAEKCQRDPWDFAVEIAELRNTGLTTADLRLLFCQGYVEHVVERTKLGAKRRRFGKLDGLLFPDNSCFVLTDTGAGAARMLQAETILAVAEVPCYDGDLRELWLGRALIKRFRQPAPDQHTILSAFEELAWPPHLDDPLSPHHYGRDAKLRLRDAISRLNRHQQHPLLRFRGDGRGQGILWQLAAVRRASATSARQQRHSRATIDK
jgi:hypothetical protein